MRGWGNKEKRGRGVSDLFKALTCIKLLESQTLRQIRKQLTTRFGNETLLLTLTRALSGVSIKAQFE